VYLGALRVNHGGRQGQPITLTSQTHERATIVGRVYVPPRSNWVRVQHLNLIGVNPARLPSPTVSGSHVSFIRDAVTNEHTSICFDVGVAAAPATAVVIGRSRIFDCGRLPADNHEHGIYLEHTRGALIEGNLIYDNADRGVQLYPDAQDTRIVGNVVYGNGEGIMISGAAGQASSGNLIEHNIVAGSLIRADIESWYPPGNPVGHGNLVTHNCIAASRRATGGSSLGGVNLAGGVVLAANVRSTLAFLDPAHHDYRLQSGSRCRLTL
jgi:hypothetical protein